MSIQFAYIWGSRFDVDELLAHCSSSVTTTFDGDGGVVAVSVQVFENGTSPVGLVTDFTQLRKRLLR